MGSGLIKVAGPDIDIVVGPKKAIIAAPNDSPADAAVPAAGSSAGRTNPPPSNINNNVLGREQACAIINPVRN